MKTISKLMLAVCFLSVVDANAELKRFVFKCPKGELRHTKFIQVNEGEILIPKHLTSAGQYISREASVIYDNVVEIPIPFNHWLSSEGAYAGPLNRYEVFTEKYSSPIVGPAKIRIYFRYSEESAPRTVFIYDLQKTSTTSSGGNTSNLPSNTVVIPTDASGPVEIIMESSKDLVN